MQVNVSDIKPYQPGSPDEFPLHASTAEARHPFPTDDYIETHLDLNEHLIRHPAATFFVRASGNSMRDAGIFDGDLMIVDRALTPRDGVIVVAVLYGELTVKRIRRQAGRLLLEPDNAAYPAIDVPAEAGFAVWGVVTHTIHTMVKQ